MFNSSDEFSDSAPGDNKERYLDDEVVSDHRSSYSADVSWTDKLEGKNQPGASKEIISFVRHIVDPCLFV